MALSARLRILTSDPECGIPMRVVVEVGHAPKDRLTVCIALPRGGKCRFSYAGGSREYCRNRQSRSVERTSFRFYPTVFCDKPGVVRTMLTATATNQKGQSATDTKEVRITC